MHIDHILSQTINTPLMVAPAKLTAIMGFLLTRNGEKAGIDLSALVATQGRAEQSASAAETRPLHRTVNDTIAVIPVLGSLVNRTHGLKAASGLVTYRELTDQLDRSVADPDITGIILDFDSFGGMAAGCERMTRTIARAAERKPVYAVIDLNCFSAAYSMAAACSRIVLTDDTAGVGSIGCIALHYDRSKRNDKEGDVYTAIFFGERKNDFSPHQPLDKEHFRRLQHSVDAFGMQFARTVAEFRRLKLDAVLDTKAGLYFGRDALDLGLADDIASFDEAAAMLIDDARKHNRKTFTGGTMSTKDRLAVLLKTQEGQQAAIELGFIETASLTKSDTYQAGYAKGLEEGRESFQRKMAEIAGVAEMAKLDSRDLLALLRHGIQDRDYSGQSAATEIQDMLASQSRQRRVSGSIWENDPVPILQHDLIDACTKDRTYTEEDQGHSH